MADVTVIHGDTDLIPVGTGTYASRSLQLGGVALRAEEARAKGKPVRRVQQWVRYARISPDDKRLAYASQISARPSAQRNWSVTAVDLATKKTLFSENGIDA